MAKATAKCTCAKCGKIFEVTQICYNRQEANRFEDYAERNYTECRDCYRKMLKEEADQSYNGDVEKLKKEIMEYYDIAKLYVLKTETNASAIIDLLKFA